MKPDLEIWANYIHSALSIVIRNTMKFMAVIHQYMWFLQGGADEGHVPKSLQEVTYLIARTQYFVQ